MSLARTLLPLVPYKLDIRLRRQYRRLNPKDRVRRFERRRRRPFYYSFRSLKDVYKPISCDGVIRSRVMLLSILCML
jgi:hypothetical protein